MNERKEFTEAIIYKVENYDLRKDVIKDLEEGHRVVIISTEADVLSFYGLLLERYGQFNLYKVESFDEVDDEFEAAVKDQDQTRDEVTLYVGKPLSESVIEVIDNLKLEGAQKRIMTMCKELLRGEGDNTKQSAVIDLLNTKLKREIAEKESLKNELDMYKSENKKLGESTSYLKSTFNLDSFISDTQVMYIKEFSNVPYLHSCIRAYNDYKNTIEQKRCKIIIFDNKLFNIKYKTIKKIQDQDQYVSDKSKYLLVGEPIVSYQVFPVLLSDLYKANYDLLIIVDRIVNNYDIVKGKNVHKFYGTNNKEVLEYLDTKLEQDFTYIISDDLKHDENSIKISYLDQDMSSNDTIMYWYSKLGNKGNDNRLIFEIFNDKNKPNEKIKRGIH